MILWNVNKLKENLISDGLSQKLCFYYIFIFVALTEIIMELSSYLPNDLDHNNYDYISSVMYLFVAILGTYLTYVANNKDKGKQFAERFFSLGLVIAIRFILIIIILAVLYELLNSSVVSEDEVPATNLTDLIFVVSISTAYYWRLIVHIKDVSNNYKGKEEHTAV